MGNFVELLKRKYGPAPLWVYLLIGVLGLAWYLRKRAAAKKPVAADQTSNDQNVLSDFAMAYPMPYTGDVTVNVPSTTLPAAKDPFDVPAYSPLPGEAHNTGPLTQGTSLQDLAQLYWGKREYANRLYNANRDTIEKAARKAGYASSQNGQILIPGINLEVPPINYQ